MNIIEFNKIIHDISMHMPLVHSYSNEDIYTDWNTHEKQYGAVNFCIQNVKRQQNMAVYGCVLYYGDRLMEDKSNRDMIFDDARNTINAICGALDGIDGIISVEDYQIEFFEQKFADELAGGYVNLTVNLEDADNMCGYN